jgi:hypothetical protein
VPWHEEARTVADGHVAATASKHADERLADDLALALGLGHAGERVEETVAGACTCISVDAELRREGVLDLLGLVAGASCPVSTNTQVS